MEFLSQPDLMLYKFVYNTMRACGRENLVFNKFSSGGRVSKRYSMLLWKVILVVYDLD